LVQKIVHDYPFHCLNHLVALKNGNSKDKTNSLARDVLEYICNKDGMIGIISKIDKLFKGDVFNLKVILN
jgi:hypothetical protein